MISRNEPAKGSSVGIQMAVTRQQGKHGAPDIGDLADQRDRPGAQQLGRWQQFVVSLEVKTLPALLEERAETRVVVPLGSANVTLVEQVHGLIADDLPVGPWYIQFGELAAVQVGLEGTPENRYIKVL